MGNWGSNSKKAEDTPAQPLPVPNNSAGFECTICMESLNSPADIIVDDDSGRSDLTDLTEVVALKCGHIFHKLCVEIWLSKRKQKACPICSDPIKKREKFRKLFPTVSPDVLAPKKPEDELQKRFKQIMKGKDPEQIKNLLDRLEISEVELDPKPKMLAKKRNEKAKQDENNVAKDGQDDGGEPRAKKRRQEGDANTAKRPKEPKIGRLV